MTFSGSAGWSSQPTVAGKWFSKCPRTSLRISPPSRVLPGRRLPQPFSRDSFHGLFAPLTLASREIRFTRALPARHLPPSGFDYPLDGFLSRATRRPCFVPAAPLGFSLRSLLLAEGHSGVFHRDSPRLPLPVGLTRPTEVCTALSNGPATGYILERVPCEPAGCLARHGRRMLPWVLPFPGIVTGELGNCFQPPPPTRFVLAAVTCDDFRRLGVSITHRLARLREPGVPLKVSAPRASWRSTACDDPGYAFTSATLGCYHPLNAASLGLRVSFQKSSGLLSGADLHATIWRQSEVTPGSGTVHEKKSRRHKSQTRQ